MSRLLLFLVESALCWVGNPRPSVRGFTHAKGDDTRVALPADNPGRFSGRQNRRIKRGKGGASVSSDDGGLYLCRSSPAYPPAPDLLALPLARAAPSPL